MQGYDLHEGGCGGSQILSPPQYSELGLSAPGAPRVPAGLPHSNQVNSLISSSSNSPSGLPSTATGRPPISLPTKTVQPAKEPQDTDVTGIVHMPSLLVISYHNYDSDDKRDDSFDLGGTQGKSPISLKQTEFSMNPFAKKMGQANYSAFNKWKKKWVAEILKKKHWSVIWGLYCL